MMEKLKARWNEFRDKISEQVWAQEIKAKWDELPSEKKHVFRLGALFGSVAVILIGMFSWGMSVRGLERDYENKKTVLALLEAGTQELAGLKSALTVEGDEGSTESWSDYIRSTAARTGVDAASVETGEEKAGEDTDLTSESLIDITVKRTNIRKLVRLVFSLEHGGRPIKLRNLNIDTKQDPEGYIDATLSVSAFKIK
jgi:hypothetical protein